MERLQKILARAGIGSRRECEQYIIKGRVTVNKKTAVIGMKADPHKDHITMDGKRIQPPEAFVYIALNKPRNVISAVKSPDPRPTVRDLIPISERVYPVGRLDIESEGLILLTNDGELANQLTHPRYGCEKVYRVLVGPEPDEKQLRAWRLGVVLEDGRRTAPAKVRFENQTDRGTWLRVTMHEGRKRQIREVGAMLGLPVFRIIRTQIGSLHLGKLKTRQWRELTGSEIAALKATGKKGVQKKGKLGPRKSMRAGRKHTSRGRQHGAAGSKGPRAKGRKHQGRKHQGRKKLRRRK